MGAVVSCIKSVFRAIGNACMAVINGIAGILKAIINGVASVLNIIISCITCGRSGHRRGGMRNNRSHGRSARVV
ncbi:hypothetical protein EDC01DRAFT_683825 [Geopyxis carbonaria]|nr:hypothetical protein EDC01DRAFT_683825 [Geopyxis carbonaria]